MLLPGALNALKAVHELGGQVLIVSSRQEASIRSILNFTGIQSLCHLIRGSVFGESKGSFLKEQNAQIYVGDHLGDVACTEF